MHWRLSLEEIRFLVYCVLLLGNFGMKSVRLPRPNQIWVDFYQSCQYFSAPIGGGRMGQGAAVRVDDGAEVDFVARGIVAVRCKIPRRY